MTLESPQKHIGATPVVDVGGKAYLTDPKGALVPIETIRAADLLIDEVIGSMFVRAEALAEQIAAFKARSFGDIYAAQEMLEQDYDTKVGGPKGNIQLVSFDGTRKVELRVADNIDFGPELHAAKKLVDECLTEWAGESGPELRAIVNRAFQVDQTGKVRSAELFSILRLDIDDTRWKNAMRAVRDSIRVLGTKEYILFHRRQNARAGWEMVPLNVSKA